jgi:hypothetical protein
MALTIHYSPSEVLRTAGNLKLGRGIRLAHCQPARHLARIIELERLNVSVMIGLRGWSWILSMGLVDEAEGCGVVLWERWK